MSHILPEIFRRVHFSHSVLFFADESFPCSIIAALNMPLQVEQHLREGRLSKLLGSCTEITS